MPNLVPAAAPGLPAAALHEIRDCLVLALGVSAKPQGYTQPERETRAYMRAAMRKVNKLTGEGWA